MRNNIYYWKCDSPLDVEKKQVYNSKYEKADISDGVRQVCKDFFKKDPDSIKPSGSEGNHYGYIVEYPDNKYFFRADDGQIDDDYMLVESEIMKTVKSHDIPVPEVYLTDTTCTKVPFRFQILQLFTEKDINVYYQKETLDIAKVAVQLGGYLSKLHSITFPGFGFINSDKLRKSQKIEGLNSDYNSYFNTKLDTHINYLVDHKLIDSTFAKEIENTIAAHTDLLQLEHGCLVHRDIAFWNILGTENSIRAIIDWDDVILGDPVDDFAILTCFYDEKLIDHVKAGYKKEKELPDNFDTRRWLHVLRNMLWKTMIRHYMGYFETAGDFYILNNENRGSLLDFTLNKLKLAVSKLKGIRS